MARTSENATHEIGPEARDEDIASLARMIAFARNAAHDLGMDQTVYCLTLSLQSISQHLKSEDPNGFAAHEDFKLVMSRH
ncbi:hypothetical protein [Pararhizobium arenae]|uniref:hypothetical protein n=1 Tax=Pararhizobium arenae TaxID=1856850 RepID=UPI000B1ADD09|nr:hypothetical protein [Pararhizobium arenae]